MFELFEYKHWTNYHIFCICCMSNISGKGIRTTFKDTTIYHIYAPLSFTFFFIFRSLPYPHCLHQKHRHRLYVASKICMRLFIFIRKCSSLPSQKKIFSFQNMWHKFTHTKNIRRQTILLKSIIKINKVFL